MQITKTIVVRSTSRRSKSRKNLAATMYDWTVSVSVKIDSKRETRDPSYFEYVRFLLHPDFRPPDRIVKSAPYEVRETGWGSFGIRVFVKIRGIVEPFLFTFDLFVDQKQVVTEFPLVINDPSPDVQMLLADRKRKAESIELSDADAIGTTDDERPPPPKQPATARHSNSSRPSVPSRDREISRQSSHRESTATAAIPTSIVVDPPQPRKSVSHSPLDSKPQSQTSSFDFDEARELLKRQLPPLNQSALFNRLSQLEGEESDYVVRWINQAAPDVVKIDKDNVFLDIVALPNQLQLDLWRFVKILDGELV